ncbi:MAG: transporter substrate-binding domain-containing protein [Alphaproteobacteria bacterium]|nr:transporter substrate-binding domain-containing protein [Alphaproteobacteria bacterium]
MTRRSVIGAVAAMTVAVFGAGTAQAQGALELNKPGVLSVATEAAFPPFSLLTPQGQVDGIEIRLFKEISKRLGLTYEPVILKWESTLVGLLAGQFDVMGTTMDVTEARQKQILYSDGWIESGAVVLVRQGSDIKKPADIKGKVIGALAASTYISASEPLGPTEIKAYKSEPEAYQDLINRNIEGVVTDQVAAAYAIKTAKLPLEITPGYVTQVQKGWGFQKARPNLAKAVNKALADMQADGTYAKIMTDMIGIVPKPEKPFRSNF